MAGKITVQYTIEPSWAQGTYTDTIEIDPADVEGLKGDDRAAVITSIVGDAVANVVTWGWIELPAAAAS